MKVGIVERDDTLYVQMTADGGKPRYTGPFDSREKADAALRDVVQRLAQSLDGFDASGGQARRVSTVH